MSSLLYHSAPLSQFTLLGEHNSNTEEIQLTKLQKAKQQDCTVCSRIKDLAFPKEAKKFSPISLRWGEFPEGIFLCKM